MCVCRIKYFYFPKQLFDNTIVFSFTFIILKNVTLLSIWNKSLRSISRFDFGVYIKLKETMASVSANVSKVMVQPINMIFRFLQSHSRVTIWIANAINKRIEGIIVGFDEYMNLVLAEAEQINIRTNFRLKLGEILLRGNTVFLIQLADPIDNRTLGSTVTDTKEETAQKLD